MTDSPAPQGDLTYWKLLAAIGCGGFAALALFVAMPEIDLMAAAAFFDGHRFGLWANPVAITRLFYTSVFVTLCVIAGTGLALALATRGGGRVPIRLWLFAAAVPALGPGLLANVILKEHWGRARPAALQLFGGDLRHSLPFEIAGECDQNCSFVSGEGSSAAAVLVVLVGLFGGRLGGRAGRAALVVLGGLWLLGAALIRMVPGRHFLSDTIFAFVLVALVGMALYALLGVGRWRGAGPGLYLGDLWRMTLRLVRGSSPRG